jgi:hypothetical protein
MGLSLLGETVEETLTRVHKIEVQAGRIQWSIAEHAYSAALSGTGNIEFSAHQWV